MTFRGNHAPTRARRAETEKWGAKMKEYARTKEYAQLKRSMIENLEARGLAEHAYTDKVKEYMDFWVQRKQLKDDIDSRGVSVMDEKRGMMVENRSVSLEVQVSRQMLAIFTALGFKEDALAEPQGGEDDEL